MESTRLLTAVGPVSSETALAVKDLVALSTARRGVAPISEQPLLSLTDPRRHAAHILVVKENALVAYAQCDLTTPDEVAMELVVHPDLALQGIERRLLEAGAYVAEQNDATFSIWSHGPTQDTVSILLNNGFTIDRTLLRLERSLLSDDSGGRHASNSPTSEPQLPAGIRAFVENQDERAWLEANALAFAWHPEQGKMTLADLRDRMKEPWFDPSIFLLAADPGTQAIQGFSWLKLEPDSRTGEIYALGVVPEAQGKKLGTTLLEASLERLGERGCTSADLYVESDNHGAIALYQKFGFAEVERHVKFRQTRD